MIYNFNIGIGWASSGVEYAQAYRAEIFRKIGQEARFVFTDMFPRDNVEHMSANIGFLDQEIIWLYTFFTDCRTAPVSYTLKQLEKTFGEKPFDFTRNGRKATYVIRGTDVYYTVYMVDETSDLVHRVEMVSHGCLIRKDYYTYCRIYSEYYAPFDNTAHLYQRRFFNEDGSIAYEEITDDDVVTYRFPDRIICSKEELVGYMVSRLGLTKDDIVIIDRSTGIGQPILQNAGPAHVFCVIHADHFSVNATDENYILWNNFYEYLFSQRNHIAAYITATDTQNQLLGEHFRKYKKADPLIATIPVGSLEKLKYPQGKRKPHSLITASRLAGEKHVDWLIEAVAIARKTIPDLTLDIYGKGAEENSMRTLILKKNCEDCIRLCGQQNLKEVYQNYEAYFSGSTSEGFGLTLMEALGAGLPIIGFDVRYGNQNFIDDGENGYLIRDIEEMDSRERIQQLSKCVIRMFREADLNAFHEHSYRKAEQYLGKEVEKRWVNLLEKMK